MPEEAIPEELVAMGAAAIVAMIPKPRPAEAMPECGLRRFRDNGCDLLASHYGANGVGPIARGRAILCAPDLFDPVLAALDLLRDGESALATAYTSFGSMNAVTSLGSSIHLDLMSGTVRIFEGEPHDDLTVFQVEFASVVTATVQEMLDTDQVIGTDGADLHNSAYKRFGALRHGQCYGAMLRLDDPDSFNPVNIAGIVDVVPHILASHEMLPLGIERHAAPTPAPAGEDWGADWE